ncbi:F-box only protein 15-like isoform X2 [Festucalex cinctus]
MSLLVPSSSSSVFLICAGAKPQPRNRAACIGRAPFGYSGRCSPVGRTEAPGFLSYLRRWHLEEPLLTTARENKYPSLVEGEEKREADILRGHPNQQTYCGANTRHQETRRNQTRECLCMVDCSLKTDLERLPPEILLKILSHLDAVSLLSLSHVNKHFRHLANDNATWHKLYMAYICWEVSKFRPTKYGEASAPADAQECPPGEWKKKYLWRMGGQEFCKWKKETRDFDPLTGLPQSMVHILRNMNVRWVLKLQDSWEKEVTLELGSVSVFKTSVMLYWGGTPMVRQSHIRSIRLCTVRKDADWCTLVCRTEDAPAHFLGKDRQVQVVFFPPAFIIGFWRGNGYVAFIMVSLHLDRLLERSLLGSPIGPYWDPEERLHNVSSPFATYSLHLGLHDAFSDIMLACFSQVTCKPGRGDRLELRPISRGDMPYHRALTGDIRLVWKCKELEGFLENCCMLTLTVDKEVYKPLWCVSTPVCFRPITVPQGGPSDDYVGGEHFQLVHHDARGLIKMTLVWHKKRQQMSIVNLAVSVFARPQNSFLS